VALPMPKRELPENTTISKMETAVNRGFRKHLKVVEFDHFKFLKFDGLEKVTYHKRLIYYGKTDN
jgi:hypothetical protein